MTFLLEWSDEDAPGAGLLDIRAQDDYDENEEAWGDDLDDDWTDDEFDEDEDEDEDDEDWDDDDEDDDWDDDDDLGDDFDARRGGRLGWE
jgi:hypothetical protein